MFARRAFTTIPASVSAMKVFQNSCYHKIDFKINENSTVKEALIRFTAFNIGCLAVTNDDNQVVGVCSERDFINKAAITEKDFYSIRVKDICTYGPKIIIAKTDDSLEACMGKMLFTPMKI